MCRAGLITEAQLEHALAVQEASGRPMAEVIVRLGYASPGAVATALAEQPAGLEERTRAAESEAGELRARVAGLEARIDGLTQIAAAAESLRRRVAELEAELAARREPDRPVETAHLLFVPAAAGYSLLPRDGPCPGPGAPVEHEGRLLHVARIGPSPLGDRRRCAYLEPTQ